MLQNLGQKLKEGSYIREHKGERKKDACYCTEVKAGELGFLRVSNSFTDQFSCISQKDVQDIIN